MPSAQRIRAGSAVVRVFASRSGAYQRWELRWTDHHGRRRRLKRSKRSAALAEARRIADDLGRGQPQSELALADIASFRAALVNLYGTGKTLELATAEVAEAIRILREGAPDTTALPSIPDLARLWVTHRPSTVTLTTDAAVDAFLAHKVQLGARPQWLAALRSYLKKFRRSFPGPILHVNAPAVTAWFTGLPDLRARSRNNHLAAVQDLLNLPELATHPHRAAIQALQPIRMGEPAVRLWTPAEFSHLLVTAARTAPDLVPVLVLGAFAKLRTGEIRRVEWADVRLDDATCALAAGKTKTKRNRLVPLPANAVAWLRACQRPSGLVWTSGASQLHRHLRRLCALAGTPWRGNAMRKSACTYADLLALDARAVATAAGNSPKMLEAHYLAFDGVTRADAEAWFAIQPPAGWTHAVVALPAPFPESQSQQPPVMDRQAP